MSSRANELHSRIIALCCREWKQSPDELRRKFEAGDIQVNDWLACVELAVLESPITFMAQRPILLDWLFPDVADNEKTEPKQQRLSADFHALLMRSKPADEKTAEIIKKIKEKGSPLTIKPRKGGKKHGK